MAETDRIVTKIDSRGEVIYTPPASDAYKQGWERIFGKKKKINAVAEVIEEKEKEQDGTQ